VRPETRVKVVLRGMTLIILTLFVVGPLSWFVLAGFMTRRAALRGFPWLSELTLEHYRRLAERLPLGQLVGDTTMLASVSSLLAVALALPCAYFISRQGGRLGRTLYALCLTTWLVPPIALSLQVYLWMLQIGLYDSLPGLIALHAVLHSTLVIFLLTPSLDVQPRRWDESAWLDGLSGLGALRRVHLPALRHLVTGLLALAFLRSWNELLFASVLTDSRVRTLPLAMLGLTTGSRIEWGEISALGTIGLAPVPLALALVLGLHLAARSSARRILPEEPVP